METLSDIFGFWQKHERFDKIAIALVGRGIGSVAIMVGVLYFMRSMAFAAAVTALYWFMWLATYELKGTKNLLASVSSEEVLRAEWDIGKCGGLWC